MFAPALDCSLYFQLGSHALSWHGHLCMARMAHFHPLGPRHALGRCKAPDFGLPSLQWHDFDHVIFGCHVWLLDDNVAAMQLSVWPWKHQKGLKLCLLQLCDSIAPDWEIFPSRRAY